MPNDLDGIKFGKLIAIRKSENTCKSGSKWICLCECGNVTEVARCGLTSGHTKSCGCSRDNFLKENKPSLKHGGAGGTNKKCERLYRVWCGMKERCNNPNHKKYEIYGGRGISVCDEWLDYGAFRKWAYLNGYDENAKRGKCTIDRINPDQGYTPINCRLVDSHMQRVNQRRCTV